MAKHKAKAKAMAMVMAMAMSTAMAKAMATDKAIATGSFFQPLLARCLLYKSCLFKLNKQFEYRTTYLKVEGVTYVEIVALLHDLQHCSA